MEDMVGYKSTCEKTSSLPKEDAWVKGSGGSRTRLDVGGLETDYIRPRVANPVRYRSVTLPSSERPVSITCWGGLSLSLLLLVSRPSYCRQTFHHLKPALLYLCPPLRVKVRHFGHKCLDYCISRC